MKHNKTRKISLILLAISISLVMVSGVNAWWDGSFQKRIEITLDNSDNSNTLTNYQIPINVSYDSDMNVDFSDLRFVDDDDTTEIDYWIKEKVNSSYAYVWVEVPQVDPSTSDTIYMYYDKSGVATTSSGVDTFILFDDFETSFNSTGIWSELNDGTNGAYTEDGHIFISYPNANYNHRVYSIEQFSPNKKLFMDDTYISGTGHMQESGFGYHQIVQQYHTSTGWNFLVGSIEYNTYTPNYPDDVKIIWKTGEVNFYNATDLIVTETLNVPTVNLSIYVGTTQYYGNPTGYVNVSTVYLSEYSDPEPSPILGSEESYTPPVSGSITVDLNNPPNDNVNTSLSIQFDYTPTFIGDEPYNCSLYTNETSWELKHTNSTSIVNSTVNSISEVFGDNGNYSWNIQCFNSTSFVFASSNRTLIIQTPTTTTTSTTTTTLEGLTYGQIKGFFCSEDGTMLIENTTTWNGTDYLSAYNSTSCEYNCSETIFGTECGNSSFINTFTLIVILVGVIFFIWFLFTYIGKLWG